MSRIIGETRRSDSFFHRDQREAGIAGLKWERRLVPLRSYAQELLRLIGIAAFVGGMILLAKVW
jgi:hypothetical protein